MQFVERTLACLLAAGMVGCLQKSQLEPVDVDAAPPPCPGHPPGWCCRRRRLAHRHRHHPRAWKAPPSLLSPSMPLPPLHLLRRR